MDFKITSPSQANLYRIETYEDSAAGSILVRIPVTLDGDIDLSRDLRFRGTTIVNGKIRIEFDLAGPTLKSAVESWPELCKAAMEAVQSQMFKSALLDGSGQPIKPQA